MNPKNLTSLPVDKEILQKIKIHCAINKMKMKDYISLLVHKDLNISEELNEK